jgi:hypothetical protein
MDQVNITDSDLLEEIIDNDYLIEDLLHNSDINNFDEIVLIFPINRNYNKFIITINRSC